MYSCNDCNGWDDSTSTISSSPSQIVRCSNNSYNGNFQNSGVHQVNLGNVRFICGQVRKDDGCCYNNQQMAREEDSPCDLDQYNRRPVKESALSRRKRYLQRYQTRNTCMPPTMPVSEYQEAYQKCYRNYKRQGPGTEKTHQSSVYCRPPWNSSMSVRPLPFEESLEAAEAKLALLEMFEGECPMDMIFMEAKRDRATENYRQARCIKEGGCFQARPIFDGAGGGGKGGRGECKSKSNLGGGGESQAFMERQQQPSKCNVGLQGKPSKRLVKKKCQRKCKHGVYMNGSQLELLEEESVLSHDADEVLNDMWKKLEDGKGNFQCHLKPKD